jgi:PAS domain S-box-containing protein
MESPSAHVPGLWDIEASNWVLDSVSDAFVLFDRNYKILHVNRACLEMSNSKASDFIGHTQEELWPELTEIVRPQYERAFATQQPVSFLLPIEHEGRWMDVRAHPSPTAMAVFYRDVTDERADESARQKLTENEERSRALLGAVGVLWTNNAHGEMEGEQLGWASLTGQSRAEYQGFGWADAVHPNDRDGTIAAWNEAVAKKITFTHEHRVRRHDGEWRVFSVRAVPVRRPDGTVREWAGIHADVTELRQATEILQRTQESLGLAMKGGRMGWWVRDIGTGEVTWSPELEEIFGLTENRFSGNRESFLEFVHPDDRAVLNEAVRQSLEDRTDYSVEFRFITKDGREGWMDGRGRAVYDEQGNPKAAYGIGMDVTERKRAEERLRESEERLRLSMAAASAGLLHFNPRTEESYWDEQCYHLYGQDPDSFVINFENWLALIHPDDRERCAEVVLSTSTSHGDFRIEFRINHPKNGERWLVAAGGTIPESEMVTGVTFDSTESKQQVAFLQATVAIGRALSSERDPQQIIQSLCDASTEAIGARFGAFFYESDGDDGKMSLYVLSGAKAADFPALASVRNRPRLSLPKGEAMLVADITQDPRFDLGEGLPEGHVPVRSFLSVPVKSRSGEVLGELLFGHPDAGRFKVPHLKLIEALAAQASVAYENSALLVQLQEAKAELEEKVSMRTADLRRANEQMQGFTYHVSHDLRGPLRAIVATSRMLQEDLSAVLDTDSQNLLSRQAAAANKLGQLIDDLLKLSRLENEKLDISSVDLSELAWEAAAEALGSHPESNVEIEIDEGLTSKADPRLLKLALLNLIENAVKYSPEGGVVRVGQMEDGTFFVSDEGIGMQAQYFERIFEPFQRLHRDQDFVGTGIGLTNVRQVITRHGGRVWAESVPGQGSKFLFTLDPATP